MRVDHRVAAAAACAAVAIALTGCGGNDAADDSDGGEGEGAKAVRVAVVMASLDNEFYVAQKEGIEAEAARQENADVSVSAGRERASADDVIGLIEDAMAKQPDAIAVNGSDTAPLIPVLKRVIAAGIPLVLFDAPADELDADVAAYIGTDNEAAGREAGAWLAEQAADGGQLGLITCVAGHPVTRARVTGFEAGLGSAFKVVAQGDAGCDRAKGRQVMEDMLSAHPDLDAVFSTSDSQSLGAAAALQAAGKDLEFVSFDAQPQVVEAIKGGKVIDASAGWSAKQIGGDAVKAAVAAAREQPVEAKQVVPVTVVDRDNAADWKG
ncbi:MAG TPA: sugar ABC transporter substrate-binding protein [Solirubrobacteraceae bacterium]|nr:sugar ABC transporter substrate-binding protein [Solirubrobacteraceae bacterium]